MELAKYFPIWNKLTPAQQARIVDTSILHNVKEGTLLHDGGPIVWDCCW